jgi:transcriptional regulator with XRE-family HTH domain
MDIAANIKKLREQQGMIQKQVASELGIGYSNYNKMENGMREPSVGELQKLAKLFSITVDELINPEEITLKEVVIEDKTVSEKVRLISQLDQEDQHAVYRIIDGMLTKNKFQTFFEQNLQPAK